MSKSKADASEDARAELMDELLEAARDVVARWSSGDLAGAVAHMHCVVRQIDEHDEDEHGDVKVAS